MGRETVRLEAYASVSRHNSPQDDSDNAAWNAFVARVREVAAQAAIEIDVDADGDLPIFGWAEDE